MGRRTARGAGQAAHPVKRGTVVWVNLEDAHSPELGKTRPAVVVSNTEHNASLPSVVVVPLSSRAPAIWPLRLPIPPIGKLTRSFAVTPGVRQVAQTRVLRSEGLLPTHVVNALSEALEGYLRD